MDLTSKKTIKELLARQGAMPSKRLGQNFLIDKGAVRQIIEAADVDSQDTVLEIGPGLGVITQELAKKVKQVIAVEKDKKMVDLLKETLKDYKNIEIITGDIRESDFLKRKSDFLKYKVVGNLPFYLTAPVIRQFLELVDTRCQPAQMTLVVQKEVGQRICQKPPRMNLLAVSVQIYAEPQIIAYIPKTSFWPQPKVDAAIVSIIPTSSQNLRTTGVREFFKIVKAGFSQPRKQLVNNFSGQLKIDKNKISAWLHQNDINPKRRAETLTIGDWINLAKSFRIG
ncbi:MAG: ribosomal RNA small subunit methyltransferase A [Candidatus Nealsonbacteria bacterium]|nr:ribosomal RNA small subunit methyltransferase A [Candidatus Nealsonbacteria bacterium]